VEEVLHLAVERAHLGGAEAAPGRQHVAFHDDDALHVPAHFLGDRIELLARLLAHEHLDRTLALEQRRDEEAAEETGGPGDEVGHARGLPDDDRPPTLPDPRAADNSPAY
jgi:hypothetical protein